MTMGERRWPIEWLSSWLAEQDVRVSIPRLATRISEIGYLLLPSRNMAEIPLTRRKSLIQPTNRMTMSERYMTMVKSNVLLLHSCIFSCHVIVIFIVKEQNSVISLNTCTCSALLWCSTNASACSGNFFSLCCSILSLLQNLSSMDMWCNDYVLRAQKIINEAKVSLFLFISIFHFVRVLDK